MHTLEELHRQKGFVSDVALLLHAFGLNVRHLGPVRERATGNALIRQELLEEMLARTLPALLPLHALLVRCVGQK